MNHRLPESTPKNWISGTIALTSKQRSTTGDRLSRDKRSQYSDCSGQGSQEKGVDDKTDAHTLKGVAGSIGAKAVQNAAGDLEVASKENVAVDKIEALLAAVVKALTPVIAGLSVLDTPAVKISTQDVVLDQAQLEQIPGELRPLLEDYDTMALEVVEKLEELPGMGRHASIVKRLSRALGEYDFDKALEVFDKLSSACAKQEA